MAGALALGDYAWVHERMLNQVLEGALPANDRLVKILNRASTYLTEHLEFFLNEPQSNLSTQTEISKVDAFIEHPEQAETDLVTFDSILEVELEVEKEEQPLSVFESESESEPASEPEPEPVTNGFEWLSSGDTEPPAEQVSPAESRPEADVTPVPPVEPEPESASAPMPPTVQTQKPQRPVFNEQEENRIVWEMFREELPEQLQSLDRLIQELQAAPTDREVRRSLERELHTLKGGARMAQLVEMGDVAHQAESILEQLGRLGSQVDASSKLGELQTYIDQINVLAERQVQAGMRVVTVAEQDEKQQQPEPESASEPVEEAAATTDTVLAKEAAEPEPVQAPTVSPVNTHEPVYDSLLERLLAEQAGSLPDRSVLSAQKVSAPLTRQEQDESTSLGGQEQIRLPAAFLDNMIEQAGNMSVQQNGLMERLQVMAEDIGEFGRTASRLKQLLRSLELETEAQIHAGYRQSAAHHAKNDDFDPLEMDQYSEIQRLSRALAESLNDLVNIEADLALQLRNSSTAVKESLNANRALQHDLLETRLIEVMVIVPRLRRIVRQTSSELDRQVVLDIEGETFRMDRHLLQKMTAPIEHLLRNAISHGIESPRERAKLGKLDQGQLVLKVFREDTEIVIQVQDDGRGLNLEQLRRKAIELKLISAYDELSEQEIQRLILRPGFSTATTVSQIAGRGVGMDVVSSEVKALGGALQIQSAPDKGTLFTVRLPFALAVNPVLFAGVQAQTYALPLGYIQGLVRLDVAKIQKYLDKADLPLTFHDQPYPLHYLGAVLEPGAQLQLQAEQMYPVVFVRTGGQCVAWVVDSINGRRDVVLQSMGSLFSRCRFYSAATLTTDGQVVLLPDMVELAERVADAEPTRLVASDQVQTVKRKRHERPHIMVIDDSITVRKVTEKLLNSENYLVETAKDGIEALEKLDKFEPDLMLMDIEMPRMDGFEVLGNVRQNPLWDHVPIIMISSRTAEKHRDRAKELGANSFLGKPYQNKELLAQIHSYLAKAAASMEQAV